MMTFDDFMKNTDKQKVVAGIMDTSRAFAGPEVLHLDLTNHCNFDCIACWCRSPLLGDKAMPEWEKKLSLPLDIIKGIFDDIREMGGLRQVKLVGGGEPFMHPQIIEIVEYIKAMDASIEIDINTNFSLVTKEKVDRLIDAGLDSFTVSVWAGTAQTYSAVHPNQNEETFERIRDVLMHVASEKRRRGIQHPKILIHDVVFNKNYHDVDAMVEFGLDIEADIIQFVPVDPIKGKTEVLVPNDAEKEALAQTLRTLRKRYNPVTLEYVDLDGRAIIFPDFNAFIRRTEQQDVESGAYDETVVEEVPCYVGWLFARVMATGSVVPCCKGHRMDMGNVREKRFKDIWCSTKYNEFRHNGIFLSKCDPYFSLIGNSAVARTGCYNCDNLWQNVPMQTMLRTFENDHPEAMTLYRSCAGWMEHPGEKKI